MKKAFLKHTLVIAILIFGFVACNSDDDSSSTGEDSSTTVVDVDSLYFYSDDSITITTVPCTLSDGTVTECYQIVTSSLPTDHEAGPWCPTNIDDAADAGGIWLEDGDVHDVDGAFIKNLATFYDDDTWMMYDSTTGDITVTNTQNDCENAANPNVGDEYQNFCVECLPSYITDLTQTWTIPITPVAQTTPTYFSTAGGPPGASTAPSTRGVALNGIEFSAPAPVDNILSAYTLAPFDDAGGHINVHQGYHYHAATEDIDDRHVITQDDGHSDLIGYALDGFAIYSLKNADNESPTDLDELRGHSDDTRGYHYHVDNAGQNNFIDGLKGAYVVVD